jgi:CRP-like cAMP-binding protein
MNVRFNAGHVIFHEGDPADHLNLIREGQVAVQFAVPHKSRITVQTVDEGEVLGGSWLLAITLPAALVK